MGWEGEIQESGCWAVLAIKSKLCESRGGRPGLSVLTSLLVSMDVKLYWKPCFGIGLSLSLICQLTSEDIKQPYLPTNATTILTVDAQLRGGEEDKGQWRSRTRPLHSDNALTYLGSVFSLSATTVLRTPVISDMLAAVLDTAVISELPPLYCTLLSELLTAVLDTSV